LTAEVLEEKKSIDALIRRGLGESALGWVTDQAIEALTFYVAELERWNRKMNLTGKQTGAQIVTDLLYDTFYVYSHIRGARSLLDMGSGAGVISIPLVILDRLLRVISVDASTKKIQFQRHVRRTLGLDNLTLFPIRIEHLESQGVEIVVAKAFGPAHVVLDKAAKHLRDNGKILLMKGRLEPVTPFPGFQIEGAVHYHLPGSTKEFKLITYKKVF
jgi:16S rRNA (guanine527-N7)-methyltransferase